MTQAFNRDCMEAMAEFPDKFFDLAVVDPPYGCGHSEEEESHNHTGLQEGWEKTWDKAKRGRFGGLFQNYYVGEGDGSAQHWDIAPGLAYFRELARVSKNQIIWGGNYFYLPATRCFLVWRKLQIPLEGFSMAPVEYAWTSFNQNAAMFEAFSTGNARSYRFHPTQKPVSLYAWIYSKFAKRGDKILDTHMGSGSSRIAAYDAGLDFWGYEIDKVYFEQAEERFQAHADQMSLFVDD